MFSSDWAQKLGLRVSQPRDSENPLRSAYVFHVFFVFGIFLTTIIKINPEIHPNNINNNTNNIIINIHALISGINLPQQRECGHGLCGA